MTYFSPGNVSDVSATLVARMSRTLLLFIPRLFSSLLDLAHVASHYLLPVKYSFVKLGTLKGRAFQSVPPY